MSLLVVDTLINDLSGGVVPGGSERAALTAYENYPGAVLYAVHPDSPCRMGTGRYKRDVLFADMLRVCREYKITTILNNGGSGRLIDVTSEVAQTLNVSTINYWHLTFHDGTFPKFIAMAALIRAKTAGAYTICTVPEVEDQFQNLMDRKLDLIAKSSKRRSVPRYRPMFDGSQFPAPIDISWDVVPAKDKACSMARWYPDKNPSGQMKLLLKWRSEYPSWEIESHFIVRSEEDPDWIKYRDTLTDAGITVKTNLSRDASLHALSDSRVHLTASHTESFGLVPVEMAAMGIPTIALEKPSRPHVLRDVLAPNAVAVYHTPDNLPSMDSFGSRDEIARTARSTYSKESYVASLRKHVENAAPVRETGLFG